jgi:hydrogenase nickel incorporation protein HypA/HybF
MHELAIANNVVDTVIESLAEVSYTRIKSVNIAIGALSGVDPSSLEFCLPMIIENTRLAGAEINVELIPLVVACRECGGHPAEATSLRCPECQSGSVDVVSGRSIQVTSVDVECLEEDLCAPDTGE